MCRQWKHACRIEHGIMLEKHVAVACPVYHDGGVLMEAQMRFIPTAEAWPVSIADMLKKGKPWRMRSQSHYTLDSLSTGTIHRGRTHSVGRSGLLHCESELL